MEYKDFIAYYKKNGKTPNQIQKPKNPLNEKQLRSRYEKYLKSLDKKKEAIERYSTDDEWEKVKALVFLRDGNTCQAMPYIPFSVYSEVKFLLHGEFSRLDPCHVFRRSAHLFLKYDIDNIVILSRLFHSRLDQYRDPFTNESISYDTTYEYWTKFIGCDRMAKLKEKIRQHKEI